MSEAFESVVMDEPVPAPPPPPRATTSTGPVTVIEPSRGWKLINVRELWEHRELLFILMWRDIKVRYKQTALGFAWAVLQPTLMMITFTLFFSRLAQLPSGGWPYPLFVFAGVLPWNFFSTSISAAGNSVVGSERLISKIYFPRLAVPFASVGATLLDLMIGFSILVVLMIWYRVVPQAQLLLVPVLVALTTLAALGVGTLLAALNVAYRDVRYVIPFFVQLWMFATPTIYMQADATAAAPATPTSAVASDAQPAAAPDRAAASSEDTVDQHNASVGGDQTPSAAEASKKMIKRLLKLNPMTTVIASFRACVLGTPIPWGDLAGASAAIVAVFFVGCFYFRRVEDSFADII